MRLFRFLDLQKTVYFFFWKVPLYGLRPFPVRFLSPVRKHGPEIIDVPFLPVAS